MAVRKDVKNQFMVGDYLLVAPLFAGEPMRKVILPKGKWYDFYTGKYVGDGETIAVDQSAGLDKIPLFVKDGGIIPLIPATLHSPKKDEILPLTVRSPAILTSTTTTAKPSTTKRAVSAGRRWK